MIVTTKEEVFAIMGKYYGNAYWREAVRNGYSQEQLLFVSEILDEINALGYNFSNLQRLTDHEDIRFVPIILKYIHQKKGWVGSLLSAFHCRSYYAYTPDLIELYHNKEYEKNKWDIGSALLLCRHKKFVPLYLEIINHPDYGDRPDPVLEILCHFKVKEAFDRLLELYQRYPDIWQWDLLKYGWYFRDQRIIPYLEPYVTGQNCEYRSMAKRAIAKLAVSE